MNTISYNSLIIPGPTPFVTMERIHEYENKKLGNVDNITLKGQFTGDFSGLAQAQQNLIDIFSKNFGVFRILESGVNIYEKSGVVVDDISFEESNYNGIVNYSVNLSAKKFNYNVVDPQNDFQYSESEDKKLELAHTISAKGINTNSLNSKSNALDNAISFVQQFSGLASAPNVYFINKKNNNFNLQSVKESIDRLNSTYSLEESYVNDLSTSLNASGIIRYTIDLSSGIKEDIINLNLNGEVQGPLNGNIGDIRSQINPLALISDYISIYGINTTPISYALNEFKILNKISFNYDFDNLPLPNPYVNYNVSINNSEVSQNTEIQINGKIVARGAFSQREALLLNKLSIVTGETHLKEISNFYLSGFYNISSKSNPNYQLRVNNVKIKKDLNNSIIEFSAVLDDKFMPNINDLTDANYNISIDFPQWIIKPNPTCNLKGFYILSDFDITSLYRKKIDLSLTLKNEINANTSDQYINTISQNFIDGATQSMQKKDSVSYSKKRSNGKVYDNLNFNIEYSFESGSNSFLPKIQ